MTQSPRAADSQLDRVVACLSARAADSQLDREAGFLLVPVAVCLSAPAAGSQLDREAVFLLVPVAAKLLVATDSVASIRSSVAGCVCAYHA